MLEKVREAHKKDGKKDSGLEEFFQYNSGLGAISFTEQGSFGENRSELRRGTKQVVDLRGLNRDEMKARILNLLNFKNKEEARRKRTMVYRLLERAKENGGELVYYPGYQDAREKKKEK